MNFTRNTGVTQVVHGKRLHLSGQVGLLADDAELTDQPVQRPDGRQVQAVPDGDVNCAESFVLRFPGNTTVHTAGQHRCNSLELLATNIGKGFSIENIHNKMTISVITDSGAFVQRQ